MSLFFMQLDSHIHAHVGFLFSPNYSVETNDDILISHSFTVCLVLNWKKNGHVISHWLN